MAELIGQTLLNRYRVDSFVGRGGMAEVYKVWDQQRAVFLAMKLLREELAEDKVFLWRFRRESQNLAQLQHPHIVRSYGLELEGRLAFLLMDYVEGSSLRGEIYDSDVPLSSRRVMEIIGPVCSALHYAHQMGMVHCDVKPANIMIQKQGIVLLADFGIARMTDAATATMVGAGTPAYMAPEQVSGEDPTPQTDIYALGVVLYEMLTGGERPFTGEHAQTTGSTSEKVRLEQMNLAAPSPRRYNPGISPELEAVVMKCLEKDPVKRYSSALDLLNALSMAMGEVKSLDLTPNSSALRVGREADKPQPGHKLEPKKPAKRAWIWPAAAGLVLVATLAVFFLAGFPAGMSGGQPLSQASATLPAAAEPSLTAPITPTHPPTAVIELTPTIDYTSVPLKEYSWYFNSGGEKEGWGEIDSNVIKPIEVVNGLLTTQSLGYDPYFFSPSGLRINASATPIIAIRMRVSAGSDAEVYFITNADKDWNESKKLGFSIQGDNQFQTYVLDMAVVYLWQGTVTQIRLDPTNTKADIEVDYIKVQRP